MSKVKNLLAGLGGAIALNVLHESMKKKDTDMPRVDLLGEEALQKTLSYFGTSISGEDNLYKATLGADLVSNAMYYSMIGGGDPKHVFTRALSIGLAAGVGALTLPEPMGLDPEPVTKTNKTKALTVAYYVAGALVTAGILKVISAKK
ncbi:MAG: hypothetical protein EOO95_02400 [Pedobacter sp.]|nr:MAG: hypothetical protein EOO95_02400 [Pedobacter sp.]